MNWGKLNEKARLDQPAGLGIRSKMLLGFGSVFLVFLAVINAIYLFGLTHTSIVGQFRMHRAEAEQRLASIADIQKTWLESWRFEREADSLGLVENPGIKAAVAAWSAQLQTARPVASLTPARILNLRSHFTSAILMSQIKPWVGPGTMYQNLLIADAATGLVIASTDSSRLGSNLSQAPCFDRARRLPGVPALELHMDPSSTNAVLHLSRTILAAGKPLAVLILETRLENMLTPLRHHLDLQGSTGRSILLDPQGMILNSDEPISGRAGGAATVTRHEPTWRAARNFDGIKQTTNQKGRAVLAVYRAVEVSPGQHWSLVVEQDMSELNAEARKAAWEVAVLWMMELAIALAITLFVARRLSRPLHDLDRAAHEVDKGNLDARATVHENDEVGHLAMTFNSMVQHIQQSQLDLEQKVQDRTAELDAINDALSVEIAEHRMIEERLRQFSRAVEQSPCSIVITDTKGNIEYVNPKFTEVTGYTFEEVRGKNPRVLKSGANPPEFYQELWNALVEGREWRGEFHNRKKDGDFYWEFASLSPIRDAAGQVTHYLAIKEDVTRRKEIETEREQLIVDLKDAIAKVKTLSGLLPICASCKKIRDDGGYWNMVELYVQEHSAATFTHGLCPDCARRLYPEIFEEAHAPNKTSATPNSPSASSGSPAV
jgi:PAS domain S-box-containing protein